MNKLNFCLDYLLEVGCCSPDLIILIEKFEYEVDETNLSNIFKQVPEDIYLDVALVIYKRQELPCCYLKILFEALVKVDHEMMYEVYLNFRNKDINETINIIKDYENEYMREIILWNESPEVLKMNSFPLPKWYYAAFNAWEELYLINKLKLSKDIINSIIEKLIYKKINMK